MKQWIRRILGEETGQALIQVSIALILLLGCAALAIDISYAYAQRRNMQNAADAGALAGAYQMCFVDPTQSTVEDVAINYATGFNLAEWASVNLSNPGVAGGLITVTTQITTPTFIAGVIGFPEITVGAQAVAACGAANQACGLSPIAFNHDVYETLDCGEIFYVWDEGSGLGRTPDLTDPTCIVSETGDYTATLPTGDYTVLAPGNRAWIQFPRPSKPFPQSTCNYNNCGVDQLDCIIANDYDGAISVSPSISNPICMPGQAGVANSLSIEVNKRISMNPPYLSNILLYDLSITCGTDDILGTCAGTPFPITGLGCVEILEAVALPGKICGVPNAKVIKAQKSCNCTSVCGGTDGTPGDPDQVKTVNMTK